VVSTVRAEVRFLTLTIAVERRGSLDSLVIVTMYRVYIQISRNYLLPVRAHARISGDGYYEMNGEENEKYNKLYKYGRRGTTRK
jgi:hypothetical protein